MRNTKVIILAALLFSSLSEGSETTKSDNEIMTCLAAAYTVQDSLRESQHPYFKTIEDSGLDKSQSCNGIKLSMRPAKNLGFRIQAQSGNRIWTVDDTKAMIKIQ